MKTIFLIATVIVLAFVLFESNGEDCSFAQGFGDRGPDRLVIIKGKALIVNLPDVGVTPATSEALIFQKVGCSACYIRAPIDAEGNYQITVGDGKYKIIVRNPSSPDFDMLLPDQERFIDTETEAAKKYSKQVFDFDVQIRVAR